MTSRTAFLFTYKRRGIAAPTLRSPENALATKADENTAKNRFLDIDTGVTSDLSISSKIINKIVKIEINNIFT